VQSIICYKRSLERENKAFTKQIKKLKNVSNSPFFYTFVLLQWHLLANALPVLPFYKLRLCLKIYINVSHYSLQAEVWKSKYIFNIMWDVWELLSFQAVFYYTAVLIALCCSQI
jgi:hypothetical protein